ncbi:pre-mRNA-splicing factor ATP-dependent RNA helicase PRP43 [Hortaea werneckii]|nr:pre-mRNA-splicing factor ATP-dependent RNA helicase PRP43 [Hortaea werneckii]KAI6881134.1 pre-mRNA-splicing factor ATP-dependent RNA helicase PRP43 [Hortaea werneckii]KAI6992870.1 pre-mRNA-splicing factor ATP-dependent RNA helicase PRP43 [Hortaea werneckii]KAI7142842.1 pre-mRNA-splicing factor ATP-dependent RNA helicase PRP43 [Hortaea werneckii]KAI7170415.1 pre-mRNA-splicing factor ATP-dependent RNA helicase PRP43 [Hortaea werneckii]
MDDLEQLEVLSLVSKVTSEINNYMGISDKTIAEYVIAEHAQTKSTAEFCDKATNEFDFPRSLAESIDRLIRTLHPKYQGTGAEDAAGLEDAEKKQEKTKKFTGLSLPDKVPSFEPEDEKENDMDDTFALLESMAGPPKGTARKRSMSPVERGDKERSSKRHRRSRSRSPRRSKNDEYLFQDEFGRTRSHHPSDREDRESRRRGRKSRRDSYDRPPEPEQDDEPVPFKIYDGRVTGVKDFGAFVNLHGVKGKVDGLVHVSAMADYKVNHPSDLVARDQHVKVKVMKVQDKRISLSMSEVDQTTGQDLNAARRMQSATGANAIGMKGGAPSVGSGVPVIEGSGAGKKQRKRLTSPERWEIRQLIASGVIKAADYPDLDEDHDAALNGEPIEDEEDVDIEVKEDEPPFLAGQTKQSLELSPIRVIKAPDGSMNRAAMQGDVLAKERRDLRQQEAQDKASKEASKTDLNQEWNDPMAGERRFASDLRQQASAQKSIEMPEWKKIATGKGDMGKRTSLSIEEQRRSLPAYKMRKQFLDAVNDYNLLIVVGDTGSGKTTQLTQYLAEAGYGDKGIVGCTQPRRVAAMSVAGRVSEEVGCRLGEEVGYTIRFEDKTNENTKIKYMTDGIMQREILLDPELSKYSVIMLDEAHERTIATDVLFGLLKKTLKRRPDMKLIVTSATLDAEKFSTYFNECPILTIPGRTFPVEIMYSREPESDYLDAALTTVMQIHLTEPPGDILLFLTGKEEIDTSCEVLFERMKALGPAVPELIVLPIYGALPSEIASRIFEPAPSGSRKVVIATNIAETSITIDGIYFVVDPGFVKQTAYDAKLGMDRLQVTPISQAQAKQRAGRAGRTGPGKCFRLYTESAFQNEMLPTTIPEIQRQNLANTILMLKAMGINDLLGFDFMDPPPTNTMLTALEELFALGALDDEGLLTRLGRRMADFPMEPALAKSLIISVELGCADEMLSIVAMISAVQSVFHRPKDKQQQADQKKARFHDSAGDHLTLLNVYNGWRGAGRSDPWCFENFIQPRNMRRAEDVRKQLVQILDRHRLRIVSCGRDTTRVRQALCSGFFRNSARKDPQEGYKTLVEGTPVYMHPSSALFGKAAEHVIYHSLVETTREYMHNVTAIEPKWLVEAAPTFFKVAGKDGTGMSKRKRAERIKPLHNKFAGEDDWRLSAQRRQGRGGGGTWG